MSLFGTILGGIASLATGGPIGLGTYIGGKLVKAGVSTPRPMMPATVTGISKIQTLPPILRLGSPGIVPASIDSVKVSGGYAGPLGLAAGTTTVYTSTGKKRKKYRRMNCANVKALKRSVRRVHGFAELARSVGFSRPPAAMKGVRPVIHRRKRACKA